MKHKGIIRLLLLVLLIISTKPAFGTAQFGDILILKNDTVTIFSNPLEQYFEKKKERTINGNEIEGICTALYRGYVATWKIENDSLFLVRIQTNYCGEQPEDLDLKREFKGKRIFANWYNGEIRSQLESMLSYMHDGYGSIFERERLFNIKKGKITNVVDTSYLEYDKNRLFPGPDFLFDTIQQLIYNNLDLSQIDSVEKEEHFQILIVFNTKGEIERISKDYEKESPYLSRIVVDATSKALKNFPLIMKVNHKNYSPPIIRIWFNTYCLKHPDDRESGCVNYRELITLKDQTETKKEDGSNNGVLWVYILVAMSFVILVMMIVKKRQKQNR